MLETDEVDDDYFTPITSSTLANIFGNSRNDEGTKNNSLKYSPPSEQSVSRVTSNVTECIFASAMFAYEWTENDYSAKGKIGFAIIHIKKSNSYEIVLYNSNKTTLSSTTITSRLEVTVKGNIYISYYDNLNKCWSICATKEAIEKAIKILENLNVIIRYSPDTDKGPPEPYLIQNKKYDVTYEPGKEDRESDTDSSLNRKTKHSILNRMANMGQSVLPRHAVSAEKTSDSSDNNETSSHSLTVRHKPIKNIVKRVNTRAPETHNVIESRHVITPTTVGNSISSFPLYTYVNGQLVPLGDTNVIASSVNKNSSDYNVNEMIISEQRISNSELRMNVGKLTDRVDQILDKLKDKDKNNIASNFQIEILQKLLTEYENKIKTYEQIITAKKIDRINITTNTNLPEFSRTESSEIDLCRNKISKLEEVILERNQEITKLNNEIKLMKENVYQLSDQKSKKEFELLNEIKDLKHSLLLQQEELVNISNNSKVNLLPNVANNASEEANKLKTVMNDTFRALSINFENNKSYSGDNIKSVIATVIKQVTIDALSFR